MSSFSRNSGNKLCPFVKDPLDECFCSDMNSLKVEAAMYYCAGKYEECEIYSRNIATEEEGLHARTRTARE